MSYQQQWSVQEQGREHEMVMVNDPAISDLNSLIKEKDVLIDTLQRKIHTTNASLQQRIDELQRIAEIVRKNSEFLGSIQNQIENTNTIVTIKTVEAVINKYQQTGDQIREIAENALSQATDECSQE
uniref:Uncharacterized protein n=1 Tax=Vannella robusta TaxID=1487602 RepID=A0A7S4MCY9_9EUKA|mmetsp:Transcript_18350/g.23241  ORF Transcript_18350/g.23241 Transcript_18350/m.23241 type:complete len:127 (+) Transcript_18350:158-538(+)